MDAFTCPECGGTAFELRLGGRDSGMVTCQGCGTAFDLPEPGSGQCPECGSLLAYSHNDGCSLTPGGVW
jgi:Zn finger protein HypA/HybF involved in hydrogenase expression